MFAIFIGRLRTVMARLAAIIGILIAKAKTDGVSFAHYEDMAFRG
jgi:hypothetical protein